MDFKNGLQKAIFYALIGLGMTWIMSTIIGALYMYINY